MRALAIASGNTLRRDDGVAHYTLDLIDGFEKRPALQLSLELSEEIAAFDVVVFVDADTSGGTPSIAAIDASPARAPLSHRSGAAEIVHLAKSLYGFRGAAWLCRIPVRDFGYGEGLSPEACQSAQEAADLIQQVYRTGSSNTQMAAPPAGGF